MSLCTKCGKCCWNWVSGDPQQGRCEFLADDNVTCKIHGRWEEHGLSQCRRELKLPVVSSLPDECGYVQEWLKQGLIERDPDQPLAADGQQRWRVK